MKQTGVWPVVIQDDDERTLAWLIFKPEDGEFAWGIYKPRPGSPAERTSWLRGELAIDEPALSEVRQLAEAQKEIARELAASLLGSADPAERARGTTLEANIRVFRV